MHRPSNKRQKCSENWTLFYANARGLTSKKVSLADILGEKKPQIALFSETMLKNGSNFEIDNYTFCGKGREKKSSGGVGILVSNHGKKIVTPHETQSEIEIIWVSVGRKDKKPIFIGLQESRNTRNCMLE